MENNDNLNNQVNENNNVQNEKNNNKTIGFVVLVISLLLLCFAGYKLFLEKTQPDKPKDENTQEQENNQNQNDNKTSYDEEKFLSFANNEEYALYLSDNKISIYDKVNSKILKENINLENKYTEYWLIYEVEIDEYAHGTDGEIVGIFAINENDGSSIYYCLENNKTMYKNTYHHMYMAEYNDYLIGQKSLNTNEVYDTVDYILDPKEEKIVFSPLNTNKHSSFHLEKYNGKYYFIESTDLVHSHYYTKGIIYSNDKKLIAEVKYFPGAYNEHEYMFTEQGELFIKKDNTLNKYNIDGKLLDSKTYEKVINIDEEYLIVVNNGKLLIEDVNFNQLAEVIEWKDSYKFETYPPKYLVGDSLSEDSESNFVKGIYMVLEDGNNYTEYCFNPKDNKVTSRKIDVLIDYDLSIHWADLS